MGRLEAAAAVYTDGKHQAAWHSDAASQSTQIHLGRGLGVV